jgi:uncharacterized damage-inducible protein DinB
MELLPYLNELYDYHYWATRRMLAAMVGLASDQLMEPWGKGLGSLHATLTHTLHAEWLWMQRWQGRSPQEFPSNDGLATIYDIRQRWEKQERDLRAFLAAQNEQSLVQVVAYKNTKGEDFELPLYQMMAHVVNHATHHRAEIAEMLAQIEVPHPGDDMHTFFLERSGQL